MSKALSPSPEYPRLHAAFERLLAEGFSQPWSGVSFRFSSAKYGAPRRFANGQGTFLKGGRWMAKGVTPALHSSMTLDLAYEEAREQARRAGIPDSSVVPLVARSIELSVSIAMDLSDGEFRNRLQVSASRMTDTDWQLENYQGHEALPQAVGRAAFETGIEALIVPSKVASGTNIVVFPHNLRPGSNLRAK